MLDSFENRKAAILHKAFTGELIETTSPTINLSNIAEDIKTGPFGTMLHSEDYIEDGIPVINPKHLVNQKICPQNNVTISPQKAKELSPYTLKENDILMARRGEMGRTAYVSQNESGWICGTGSIIIRMPREYQGTLYSLILSSRSVVAFLEANAKGSTMKNLNEKIVGLIPIPYFSIEEQQKIVRILDNLLTFEQKAKDLCNVIEKIDLMKKAILARAFRGELGTNDPNEESAVHLLRECIQHKEKSL